MGYTYLSRQTRAAGCYVPNSLRGCSLSVEGIHKILLRFSPQPTKTIRVFV